MTNDIFKDKAYKHTKRIIGFIDKESESPTFGCADRAYWHYKTIDYFNARYQEAILILTFFYLEKDGFLYRNEKLLALIQGMVDFWLKNLNSNGSVNEVYPFEQSFCATAFTTYAITEAVLLLSANGNKRLQEFFISADNSLKKVGIWLCKNGNWHISNQIAACAIALYNLGELLQERKFLEESKKRINFLLEDYEKNGFFREYGGFDLGYNTLTMSCLARYWQKSHNERIFKTLLKMDEFVGYNLDKYGRYDNIKMSRNTEFIYPFSFKVIKSLLLEKIKIGLQEDLILNPDWLDDRYLTGLLNDYLMTYYF